MPPNAMRRRPASRTLARRRVRCPTSPPCATRSRPRAPACPPPADSETTARRERDALTQEHAARTARRRRHCGGTRRLGAARRGRRASGRRVGGTQGCRRGRACVTGRRFRRRSRYVGPRRSMRWRWPKRRIAVAAETLTEAVDRSTASRPGGAFRRGGARRRTGGSGAGRRACRPGRAGVAGGGRSDRRTPGCRAQRCRTRLRRSRPNRKTRRAGAWIVCSRSARRWVR